VNSGRRHGGGERLCLLVALVVVGCARPPVRSAPGANDRVEGVRHVEGRPPVALLARDGDPSASIAVAVFTEGVDPPHGAEVAVALSAVVDARLAAAGLPGVSVIPGAEGFRVRTLLPSAASAAQIVTALTKALLDPVTEDGPDTAAAARKLSALARRPLPDPALHVAAQCAGEPYAVSPGGDAARSPGGDAARPASTAAPAPISTATLEIWRSQSHGLGRVAFAVVGAPADIEAVATAVAGTPAWPTGSPALASPPKVDDLLAYDATALLPRGDARVTVLVETPDAERAVVAANALGDSRGSLALRLSALEPLARIADVTGALHAGWGCLRVTVDLPSPDGSADPPTRLAAATDLLRQETLSEIENARGSASVVRELVNQAGDPRDAAERLAYWTLLLSRGPASSRPEGPPVVGAVIGLTFGETRGETRGETKEEPNLGPRVAAIRAELARAESARREPVGEVRVKVERGQSALWVLVASPCGTEAETDADAGAGALAALALAARTRRDAEGSGAVAEEWITTDGLGLVVHAPPLPGESSAALARRVGGLAARGFGGSLADARDVNAARALLLSSSAEGSHAFAVLADAVAPGHPSWILPSGTTESLERASDPLVRARLDALRAGPLRVAVLANQDASQGDVVAETLGAFLPRRASRPPSCPASTTALPPRPGTYAVETPGASSAEAWLAFALPPEDARASATTVAAALAAPHGLLERALGSGLARSWGAKVMGPPRDSLLAVRIESAQGSLDAAVAETRVLFDRLRQEGLSDADRALGLAAVARDRIESSVDPKTRLAALWRGDAETLPESRSEAIRAFTARTFQGDALIIVASRPPRIAVTKSP
jgi:hypothetical protein